MVTYFNRKDMVDFGNYLLSEKREKAVKKANRKGVWHSDIENWLEQKRQQPTPDAE